MADLNGFVVAAYVVMWIGLVGYVIRLLGVTRDARRRLDEASDAGRKA